jgi:predicted nucleic acid-binding protein
VIYLDSSALLKLVHEEPESGALADWLTDQTGTVLLSSELAGVEVIRACRQINPDTLPEARALLAGLDLIPLTGAVVAEAGDVGETTLRSLYAIHLASALSIRADLSAFIAYDHRLSKAASAAGLRLLTPGT